MSLCRRYKYIALTFVPQALYGGIIPLEISQEIIPNITRVLLLFREVPPDDLNE